MEGVSGKPRKPPKTAPVFNYYYIFNYILYNYILYIISYCTKLHYLFIGTNTTILLEFSFVTLLQAHVNYENTSWRKQFSDIIDVSLTNVWLANSLCIT